VPAPSACPRHRRARAIGVPAPSACPRHRRARAIVAGVVDHRVYGMLLVGGKGAQHVVHQLARTKGPVDPAPQTPELGRTQLLDDVLRTVVAARRAP